MLTLEQLALVPVYREKWKALALSTEPIEYQKASLAVEAAYTEINERTPEIVFFSSPYAARKYFTQRRITKLQSNQRRLQLGVYLQSRPEGLLRRYILKQLEFSLRIDQAMEREEQIWSQLGRALSRDDCINPDTWASQGSWLDFCISVLNCAHDPKGWSVFQSLMFSCGWLFPFKNICLVCDRPIKLSLDRKQRLHAVGEPAIQFADGYSVYSQHGVTIRKRK